MNYNEVIGFALMLGATCGVGMVVGVIIERYRLYKPTSKRIAKDREVLMARINADKVYLEELESLILERQKSLVGFASSLS